MKKVFWTSVVWIVLFGGFALYMKWFNQPLAKTVTSFIYPGEECPVLQCDVPVCEECECPDCPDCETYVEPVACNCPAQTVTDLDVCTKLTEQLDRIEKKISGTSTEKSEEDFEKLMEEFKAWYESKQ